MTMLEPVELLKAILPKLSTPKLTAVPKDKPQHSYPTHLNTPFAQALKDHPITKKDQS